MYPLSRNISYLQGGILSLRISPLSSLQGCILSLGNTSSLQSSLIVTRTITCHYNTHRLQCSQAVTVAFTIIYICCHIYSHYGTPGSVSLYLLEAAVLCFTGYGQWGSTVNTGRYSEITCTVRDCMDCMYCMYYMYCLYCM